MRESWSFMSTTYTTGNGSRGEMTMYAVRTIGIKKMCIRDRRRALLFGGDGAAAMRFNTFSRWTTSDDFI